MRVRIRMRIALRIVVLTCLSSAVTAQTVSFEQEVVDTSGPIDPWMKALGDLDGDGKPELIVAGRGGPVVFYHNPTWTKYTLDSSIDPAGSSTDITTADIDSDGDIDVALGNGTWFENPLPNGNPISGSWRVNSFDNVRGHDIFMADLDGDGDIDAVKRDQNSGGVTIRVVRQNNDGSWTVRTISDVPYGEGLNVTDLDGDGDKDIIISQFWYENSGDIIDGAWQQREYSSSYTYEKVVVEIGDINRDGRDDIVVSPAESGDNQYRISWFATPANPQSQSDFSETVIQENVQTVVHALQIADFDGDGQLDIVTAEMYQSNNPDEVTVHVNGNNGQAWSRVVVANDGSHNVQAGDIDGDGDMDFLGANWNSGGASDDGAVKIWWNQLDGGAPPPPPPPPSGLPLDQWQRHEVDANKPWRSVFVQGSDIDGDGLQDIVTGGWWYRNPGDVSQNWTRNTIGTDLKNMATVHDFDGDGDQDILGTKGEGSEFNATFVWADNDGNGQFTIRTNVSRGEGDFLQGVALDRFSLGGPLEIALSWHQADNGVQMLTVPDNPATETWSWRRISSTSQDEQISSGDIDRDGDADLVLGTQWLRNDAGTWTNFVLNGTSGKPDRNRLADINDDGVIDVVVGFEAISNPGKLAWYEGPQNATDTWPERIISNNVIGPMSIDVGDLDQDGDLDVVVGEHNLTNPSSARTYVFENANGAGTSWIEHLVHTGDEHHDGTQLVDIDGDGDLDIISIGWNSTAVTLYENKALNGGGNNPIAPNPPTGLTAD